MKKNTITKVLIALVMVALLCALCACGGGGGSSGGGGNSSGTTTTKALNTPNIGIQNGVVSWISVGKAGSYEYIIINADGEEGEVQTTTDKSITIQEGESVKVRAIPSDTSKYAPSEWSQVTTYVAGINTQIINLVKGIQSYVDILNDTKTSDTLSADVAVGGYFTSGSSTKTVSLAAKANAGKNNPSAIIDFKLNDVAYVSIGYKDGKILVREPINFINTDDEVANAFAIDVAALNPAIGVAVDALMDVIAEQDISFSVVTEAVEGILGQFPMDLEPLIKLEPKGNETTLGIKMELLKTGITLLPTLLKMKDDSAIAEMVDGYIGYANKAMEVIGQDSIKLGGRDLSWATIKSHINGAPGEESLINIKATYNGKAISKLALELDFSALNIEDVDYKAGLNVDINAFSTSKTVDIDTSAFKAKDLAVTAKAALPQKDLAATVTATLRLSDGFAAAGNKIATVTVDVEGKENSKATAYGYITDAGAYVDFTPVFNMFGVTGYDTKFKQELGFSVIAMLNASATGDEAQNAALDGVEVAGFDVGAIVEEFSAADDKIEYICNFVYNNIIAKFDDSVVANEKAGQADVIAWLFNLELGNTQSYVRDYVKFYNQQTTFEAIIDTIVGIHDANVETLKAATNTTATTAGIQLLLEDEGNDLLDYVANFVRIPSISGGNPNFNDLKEINNAAALKDWLNWVFPESNEYRGLVEDILGIDLEAIIDDGLYLEAENLGGLNGTIYACADATKAESYVELTGGIALNATRADNLAAVTDAVDFTNKTADEKYSIAVSMLALLDAVREYGAAE